jgi:hypothetical protein
VLNGVTRHAIEEDSRSRGGEECPNPIPEFSREATMLEKIHEVVPSHGVESLFDVKLEEEARCFGAMKFASKVPHIHVNIMDAPFFFINALWALDTSESIWGASRAAIIFAMYLAMVWIRRIGL